MSINLLYCGLLCPDAQIMSGEMSTCCSSPPNVACWVVDLTQSSMSSDSMTSDREGSAGNTFRSAFKMVAGLRETASDALYHFSGQCWMVNLYMRVFSFNLNWGFWILLRFLSLNNPFSGSWSVTTKRFGQPITNMQHFSNAHAIAAALLSIGAYLRSASMQNLLPANIRGQPSRQQTGVLSMVHEQYFYSSRMPIPSLLQSRMRQVARSFSNVEMLFRTRLTMTSLECSNASSRLLFHIKCESRLTRSWKGSMTGTT